jgi:hypothetical protein
MNAVDFEALRAELEVFQRNLLQSKSEEYAHAYANQNQDRLLNFKEGALMEDRLPEEYLRSLQIKHIVSIKKMIRDIKQTEAIAPIALWREKLMDINSYNILLLALIIERIDKFDNLKHE